MHLIPLYAVDAELAVRETRVIYILTERDGLPPGNYGLLEFYCPDPTCDCRRVILNVAEEKQPDRFLAAISYAFDPDDEMPGPFLDPMIIQGEHADELLRLVEGIVLSDSLYTARLERHYELVKQAASDPQHPAYPRLQQVLTKDARDFPRPAPWKELVGRNEPCPCGSGRKYKYCCERRG